MGQAGPGAGLIALRLLGPLLSPVLTLARSLASCPGRAVGHPCPRCSVPTAFLARGVKARACPSVRPLAQGFCALQRESRATITEPCSEACASALPAVMRVTPWGPGLVASRGVPQAADPPSTALGQRAASGVIVFL